MRDGATIPAEDTMRVDVVTDGAGFRAIYNGIDVSASCFAADSDEGWVDVYVDRRGTLAQFSKFEVGDDGEMLSERRYGAVFIEPYEYPWTTRKPHA